jgi:hypothetical protein
LTVWIRYSVATEVSTYLQLKHGQLMPQQRDLGFQLRLRPERRGQGMDEQPLEVGHHAPR